jgi:uroporphyrinogen decarboxylase
MNVRDRFVNCVLGLNADRPVVSADARWPETSVRWKNEGMTEDYDFGYDFNEYAGFGATGINIGGFEPMFETRVLEDLGEKQRIIDGFGVEMIILKSDTRLQQYLKYPVESRPDWEKIIPRLEPDAPGRFPEGWIEKTRAVNEAGTVPVTLGTGRMSGFFGYLRQLMGDNCYYTFYDDPGLINDMLDFQEKRLRSIIEKAAGAVRIDRLLFWEDMCYKNGPLIGPDMFAQFLLPHYSAMVGTAKKCGIPVIEVDSDGLIDKLLPLWLEAGVNAFQPFEVQAGMDVNRTRKEFGANFAIHGGVDKRRLTKGKKEIDAEIERIRPAFDLGRFLPSMDHSIPPDVSFYNYQYYLEKLKKSMGV